jgi:hypothetical protein
MHGNGEYYYYKMAMNGKFKENGKYIGQFRQSLRNGRGVYTLPNGNTYEGEFLNNIPNGYGIFRWKEGSLYDGPWRDGKRHGATGVLLSSDGFSGTRVVGWIIAWRDGELPHTRGDRCMTVLG